MTRDSYYDRRTVLKATGGLLSVAGATSTVVAAGSEDERYEGGTGIGAFLNEEAQFKDHPIWTGEIADRRGEEVVDVSVGALTEVNSPPDLPDRLPFAFAPQVVNVSPGATVRWTWVSNPYDQPIPHDVTSLVDENGDVVLESHAGQRFHHHDRYTPREDEEDVNPTFEFEFEERGNHLYYCTPHGAPFEEQREEGHDISYNLVGMRGAVKVSGDAL